MLGQTQLLFLKMFAVSFGRLGIVKWLQLVDMLLSLASHPDSILIGFDGALPHLEAVHSHIHVHLVVRLVSHLRLRWAPSTSHRYDAWVLFLLADVGYGRIVVLPERLDASMVLALV